MKRHIGMHLTSALLVLSAGALPGCDQNGGPGPGGDGDMRVGPGPGGGAFTFDTATVDPGASGAAVGLVVDSQGAPHVLYFSGGDEATCNLAGSTTKYRPAQLWHGTRAGAGGAFTKLAVSGNDAEVNGLSVDLDPKVDRPVVAYQGGMKGIDFCAGSDMMLGRWSGTAWQRTIVAGKSTAGVGAVETSGDVVGVWPALAISKTGVFSLAWQDTHYGYAKDDFFKADLELATGTDGNLMPGESVQQDGAGVQTVMTLDGQGRPVLAYGSTRDGGIITAVRTMPGKFTTTKLLSTTAPIGPAIAAAPSGRLGLAYYDPDLKVLRLRESDDGVTWGSPDVVDRDGDVGRVVSLRYDSMSRPVLAYYSCGTYRPGQGCDAATDQLRVARREGEVWLTAAVDDGGDGACGTALSLWLTADDRMHVAYQCTLFDHDSGQFKATVKYASQR